MTDIAPETQHKPLDTVTLFHKASSPVSVRVATLLKQTSATASQTATEDQASNHSAQNALERKEEFELNITEDPPTADQLKNILEYIGKSKISSVVRGATTEKDALRKFKENADNFQWPVVSSTLAS